MAREWLDNSAIQNGWRNQVHQCTQAHNEETEIPSTQLPDWRQEIWLVDPARCQYSNEFGENGHFLAGKARIGVGLAGLLLWVSSVLWRRSWNRVLQTQHWLLHQSGSTANSRILAVWSCKRIMMKTWAQELYGSWMFLMQYLLTGLYIYI